MALLAHNSTDAERFRYCTFAERFESAQHVRENGGTIMGTPPINFGVTLNGTTDYITYRRVDSLFDTSIISFVLEFYPATAANEDADRHIISSTGDDYRVKHLNAASSYALQITLGNIDISSIPYATYSPYWYTGSRNVLVISSTSGNTNVWMNGVQILTADATAWTPLPPAVLYVGSGSAGTELFSGKISTVKVFHSLLDADDATAYYNNTMYNYRNRAVLDLPMLAEQHDPTNVRTLDVSGYDNHATFGDGSTPVTYPTKLTGRGYSFDGGDYLDVGDNAGLRIGTNNFFVMALINQRVPSTYDVLVSKGSVGVGEFMLGFYTPAYVLRFLADAGSFNRVWNPGSASFWVGRYNTVGYTRIGDVGNLFVNGVIVDTNTGYTGIDLNSTDAMYVGDAVGLGRAYNGQIGQVLYSSIEGISSIQIADLHLQMMRGINRA